MLATFMEVLDTSVANVALPHIAGTLGAGTEESTWILTSYLVANAIILPVSGSLGAVVGRKRLFVTCHRHLHAGGTKSPRKADASSRGQRSDIIDRRESCIHCARR